MSRTSRAPRKRATDDRDSETILAALAGPPAWWERFVGQLELAGGAIAPAAKAAGVGRSTVYDALKDRPGLREEIDALRETAIEQVEATLFACALNPAQTADRIFFLKTRKPERYGDSLRADQIAQIRESARRATLAELREEIARMQPAARDVLLAHLAKIAGELTT